MIVFCSVSLQTYAETLMTSIAAAINHDSGIRAARQDLLIGKEKIAQGRSALLPQVTLSATNGVTDQREQNSKYYKREYQVSVQQTLFDMSKYTALSQGKLSDRLAILTYGQAEEELVMNVADAYLSILWRQTAFKTMQSAKEMFKAQLASAKLQLSLGEGTRTDVDEAQSNYDSALAEAISADAELELVSNVYHRLTGLDVSQLHFTDKTCPQPNLTVDRKQAWADVLDNALVLKIAALKVEQAQADLTAAKQAHLPTLNAEASYSEDKDRMVGQGGLGSQRSQNKNSYIGFNLSMPLYSGGRDASLVKEMSSRLVQSKELLENEERLAFQETQSVLMSLQHGAALLRAREQAVVSANNKLKSTKYGRQVGLRTSLDELNAIKEYYDSVDKKAEANYQLLIAKLKLARIRGQLNEDFLAAVECL